MAGKIGSEVAYRTTLEKNSLSDLKKTYESLPEMKRVIAEKRSDEIQAERVKTAELIAKNQPPKAVINQHFSEMSQIIRKGA